MGRVANNGVANTTRASYENPSRLNQASREMRCTIRSQPLARQGSDIKDLGCSKEGHALVRSNTDTLEPVRLPDVRQLRHWCIVTAGFYLKPDTVATGEIRLAVKPTLSCHQGTHRHGGVGYSRRQRRWLQRLEHRVHECTLSHDRKCSAICGVLSSSSLYAVSTSRHTGMPSCTSRWRSLRVSTISLPSASRT